MALCVHNAAVTLFNYLLFNISLLLHSQYTMSYNYQHSCGKPKLGTYIIERTIGRGVFSVVRLGTHTITGVQVAMKIVDKTRLDSENLGKIRRESEILKRLHHPNIVRLFQVMETTKLLCMVMEYLPNGEVFDYIAVRGKITESEARVKFMEVVRAVHYIHTCGVVHRDLKAENLLFDANMNIKIVDFSFGTQYAETNSPPLLTTWCGSPPYAAPEIFQGEPYVGTKADIWSLGVILYVMVCGTLPFDAQPLPLLKRQVLSGIFHVPQWLSHECEQLMRSMLTKEPTMRPSAERLTQHPWFHPASAEHSQGSSLRTRCISDLGTCPSATAYSQQGKAFLGAAANPVGDRTPSRGQKRCTTSMVTPSDGELTLAADVEVGKFNELILFIMESYGLPKTQVIDSLSRKTYDHLTATYFLLGEKLNKRGKEFPLPPHHNSPMDVETDKISRLTPSAGTVKTAKYSLDDSAVDVEQACSPLESVDSSIAIQSTCSSSPKAMEVNTATMANDCCSFKTSLTVDPVGTIGHSAIFSCASSSNDEGSTGACSGTPMQTSIPGSAFHTRLSDKLPARRNLTRRKYGIHFRDGDLSQFTRNVLDEQVNLDRPTDSDLSEDGGHTQ